MFGMGFTEILFIAVIAILFLGPDKLPSAMIDIAKFFRNAKNAIGNVKDTLEDEMSMSDIKKEALAYKEQIASMTDTLDVKQQIASEVDGLKSSMSLEDSMSEPTPQESAPQEVTFKKKKKKEKDEKVEDSDV